MLQKSSATWETNTCDLSIKKILFMSFFPLGNILFLDIETVPQHSSYEELSEDWKELWNKKVLHLTRDDLEQSPGSLYGRAGLYAEFGKIICISCGIISAGGAEKKLTLKSFYSLDEKMLLSEFCEMLSKWASDSNKYLCGHNGKEFDFPFLCRRLLICGLPIPAILNLAGKKPWEIQHLDTLELWKFGEYKNFTSLNLLAHALGIASSKDDIDGSMVADVFWKDQDLERIVRYCQKDVVTLAQIYLRLNGVATISPQNIDIKS